MVNAVRVILPAISLFVVIFLHTVSSSENVNAQETYNSEAFGIGVQYPSDWRVEDDFADPKAEFTQIATFTLSPAISQSYSDGTVTIYVDNNPASQNLGTMMDMRIATDEESVEDFELVDSGIEGSLSGSPAFTYSSSFKDELGDEVTSLDVGSIINGKLYQINYYAYPDRYGANLQSAYTIINSFKVNSVDQSTDFGGGRGTTDFLQEDRSTDFGGKGFDSSNLSGGGSDLSSDFP